MFITWYSEFSDFFASLTLFLLKPQPIKAEKHNHQIHIKEAKLDEETFSSSISLFLMFGLSNLQ